MMRKVMAIRRRNLSIRQQPISSKVDAAKAFWRKHKDFAKKLSDVLLKNIKDPPTDAQIVAFAAECGVTNFNPKLVKALP